MLDAVSVAAPTSRARSTRFLSRVTVRARPAPPPVARNLPPLRSYVLGARLPHTPHSTVPAQGSQPSVHDPRPRRAALRAPLRPPPDRGAGGRRGRLPAQVLPAGRPEHGDGDRRDRSGPRGEPRLPVLLALLP